MTATPVALGLLEGAIEGLLADDPHLRKPLQGLEGRCLALYLRGLEQEIFLSVDAGVLRFSSHWQGQTDARLEGAPLALLRAARDPNNVDALFSGDVLLSGDAGVVRGFSDFFSTLRPDWEEYAAAWLGDAPARQLGRWLGAAGRQLRDTATILRLDVEEYLHEESRNLPRREEVAEFLNAVDGLRDDVDRLAQRVSRLQLRAMERGS